MYILFFIEYIVKVRKYSYNTSVDNDTVLNPNLIKKHISRPTIFENKVSIRM